ncbi:hypothetical protein CGLO_18455 [Colletotrichum gloeosporioides Cg-14]|uniref:Uncharacterized protein n=1 Tax=Colletotrichum gloeosporioides (strain Cg-14) TaxID=1237896 RepID=T0L4B1_COLGC|nr:hypothetical protein CGLO_18455 [Colletotrichum gloeosporioides Cg-14]
MPLMYSLHV